MKRLNLCAFALCALIARADLAASDEDAGGSPSVPAAMEIVVTANRIETPLREVGSSMTVLSAEDIEERQETDVSDSLKAVPSLDVVRNGGPGGSTSVFIRGANSEHTLVLLDGIEANNPVTPSRAFNFAGLDPENIERIEVLRGPQSTLYGSDAMGGVVNIITKKGSGPAAPYASFEGGSYESFIERAGVGGGDDEASYSLGLSRQDVGGVSAADSSYGNKEKDRFHSTNFSSRLELSPSCSPLSGRVFVRYNESKTDLDNHGGAGGDDPNRLATNEEFFSRAEVSAEIARNLLKQTYGISYSDQSFEDNNDPDTLSSESLRSKYEGEITKADLQNVLTPAEDLSFIVGLESQVEEADSRLRSDGTFGPFEDHFSAPSATTNAAYVHGLLGLWERLYSTAGVRLDEHSKFGSEVTWKFTEALLIHETGTKISGSAATGYKAPSLFQLYSSYGSQDLEAEKVLGVDGGIEQELGSDDYVLGITYFRNNFDKLISFEPNSFKFFNINEAVTEGVEVYSRNQVTERASIELNYSYTDTQDDNGRSLLRRARNKFGGEVRFKATETASLGLQVLYVGRRFDDNYSTFPATRVSLGGYTLLNLTGTFELSDKVSLYARVDNMFDRDYEDVYGFGTLGAAAYGGIRVRM